MTIYLQGTVLDFKQCIPHGDKIIFIKSGSVSVSDDVGLMFDHGGKKWGRDDLKIHIGESGVAFRYALPDSWASSFEDQCNEIGTYLGVSAGLTISKSEIMTIEGHTVQVVHAATINELSLLSKQPAIKSTYARIVSADTCGELSDDVESGRFDIVGRVIGLLRKTKALDNDGIVRYSDSPSDYDRAADKFQRELLRLA